MDALDAQIVLGKGNYSVDKYGSMAVQTCEAGMFDESDDTTLVCHTDADMK